MLLVIFTIVVIILAIFCFQNKNEEPEKIFGVYSQPGKWRTKMKVQRYIDLLFGSSTLSRAEMLEKLQPLSDHEKAFDAVFFHAANFDGFYICGGIERRRNAKANALLYIVVPGIGLLCSENLPKTSLDVDPESLVLKKEFSAGGISFSPVKPMNTWKLCFKGKMRSQLHPQELIDVQLDADWTSDLPYFLIDSDMDSTVLAKAIAREMWTSSYFNTLKKAHQIHYEQMGTLGGTLFVNSREFSLKMAAFRDHSFGEKRDWTLMHRYIFFMMFLRDGTNVSVGIVSHPCTTSHLELGYVVYPDKTIYAIQTCDLLLYQHGENGRPPKEMAFTFEVNKKNFEVKCFVELEHDHFKGDDREVRLVERFMKYEVDGVDGHGISEWCYKNPYTS